MDPDRASRAATGCALAAVLAACALLAAETVAPWSRTASAIAGADDRLWWVLSLTGIAVVAVGLAFWRRRAPGGGEQMRERLANERPARKLFARQPQAPPPFPSLPRGEGWVGGEAARRSSSRFQRFTQDAPVGIALCRGDGHIEFANDEYLRVIGWQREEFEQARADARRRAVLGCLGAAPGPRQEREYVRRDGTRVPLLVGLSSQPDGFAAFVVDLTAEKRAREALRKSEERFRALADNIPQLAWIVDDRGRITWYNQRWLEYLGFTPEELIADGRLQTIHPDHMERAIERGTRSFLTGEVWEDTFPLLGKDGRYRWFLSRAVPIRDHAGGVVQWFGTATDITEQREAQDELKEADRRKTEFLGVLSHELRNPLAPICNGLFIIEKTLGTNEQAKRAVTIIGRQVRHMARLVDDLLDITRITQGKIHLQRRRFDLNDLARSQIEDHRSLFETEGVRLELVTAPEPVPVSGDWDRLAQAIGNILQNAAKFSNRGGTTRVAVSGDEGSEKCAALRVADEGVGMSPEMLSRLFQPFTQADATLDRSKGGLGLGMALAKGLVELHEGTLSAHSEGLGQGSEFVMHLPLALDRLVGVRPRRARVGRTPRRVLVIEDNVDAADSLRSALSLDRHDVAVAYDGHEGLAMARELRPEIILCDIGLPGMDGYAVARAIRADEALQGTYLVALTGYASAQDVRRAAESGFQRHVAKPPDPEALEQLLSEAPPAAS